MRYNKDLDIKLGKITEKNNYTRWMTPCSTMHVACLLVVVTVTFQACSSNSYIESAVNDLTYILEDSTETFQGNVEKINVQSVSERRLQESGRNITWIETKLNQYTKAYTKAIKTSADNIVSAIRDDLDEKSFDEYTAIFQGALDYGAQLKVTTNVFVDQCWKRTRKAVKTVLGAEQEGVRQEHLRVFAGSLADDAKRFVESTSTEAMDIAEAIEEN